MSLDGDIFDELSTEKMMTRIIEELHYRSKPSFIKNHSYIFGGDIIISFDLESKIIGLLGKDLSPEKIVETLINSEG